MGVRGLRALFCGAVATTLVFSGAPAAHADTGTSPAAPYYLALGDSLSQGVQPDASGHSVETNHGYVDALYALYSREVPGLQLAKLGCPGETTSTMINGGICSYPLGAQLAQATDFLANHHAVLVTIDIGANNVDGCVTGGVPDAACVAGGIHDAAHDLPVIMQALRSVDPNVPIVAMNYYDPFLAAWLTGPSGRALAAASISLAQTFNSTLGTVYADFGTSVADVEGAFVTTNSNDIPGIGVPVNTALVCVWTWMCAPPPVGPNIHANANGYFVIAAEFITKIGVL